MKLVTEYEVGDIFTRDHRSKGTLENMKHGVFILTGLPLTENAEIIKLRHIATNTEYLLNKSWLSTAFEYRYNFNRDLPIRGF